MPFFATCPYCSTRVKVADSDMGANHACFECYQSFLAYPDDHPKRERPRSTETKSAPTTAPPNEPRASKDQPDIAEPAWVPPPVGDGARLADSLNAASVTALLLSGSALTILALGTSFWLGVGLAGLAVLVVVLGFLVGMSNPRPLDLWWLAAAALVSLGVLGVVGLRPRWLHPRWAIDIAAPIETNKLVVVDPQSQTVVRPVDGAEFVDAWQFSIRQADVEVRIEGARVTPFSWGEPGSKAPPPRLVLTLKLANSGFLRRVVYQSPSGSDSGLKLRDSAGKSCAAQSGSPSAGKKQVLEPGEYLEDTLVFDVPAADISHLDLELPASAWGGDGICRFRIPRDMVAFPQPKAKKK